MSVSSSVPGRCDVQRCRRTGARVGMSPGASVMTVSCTLRAFPRRPRGVALLIALLAVALAVILIAGLLDRGELTVARTRNVLRSAQAEAYAHGLEAYAAEVLLKDPPSQDNHADIWAQPLPPQSVPGGTISAKLRDMNGCFNLNNLVIINNVDAQKSWRAVFGRLLAVHGVDPGIEDAVIDWLDADSGSEGNGGAEDPAYLGMPVPYRAANRAFTQVSELRLVRGVTGEIYSDLAPDICVLPPGTKLNVNTATLGVLQSLVPGISRSLAETLWQNGNANWNSIAAFVLELPQGGTGIGELKSQLGLASSYFQARSEVVFDDVPFTFYSLIERRNGGGIRVLARSRGSDDALTGAAFDASSLREQD